MVSDVQLGKLMFVEDGAVSYGSYVYDEPSRDSDERLIALGDVSAIVYSETLGDLRAITAE